MSIDMKSQVRAYADFLDSTLPVLEATDAMVELIGDPPVQPVQERPVRPIEPRPKPIIRAQRRRGVWAAAAAVTVGLLIGGVVWLAGGGSEEDVINQTTITTAPASTSTLTPRTTVTLADLDGEVVGRTEVRETVFCATPVAALWPC